MPRINMYVRNEDLEAYKAIKDKPEWLHDAIACTVPYGGKLPFTTLSAVSDLQPKQPLASKDVPMRPVDEKSKESKNE